MSRCTFCGKTSPMTEYHAITGEGPLCLPCARLDIIGWLGDCDPDEIKKLRRRAEDFLRKNPAALREILISLISGNLIQYEDCM